MNFVADGNRVCDPILLDLVLTKSGWRAFWRTIEIEQFLHGITQSGLEWSQRSPYCKSSLYFILSKLYEPRTHKCWKLKLAD